MENKRFIKIKYIILIFVMGAIILPFYLIFIMAFKHGDEIFHGKYFLPSLNLTAHNFIVVFNSAPFLTYLINTIIVVTGILFLQLILIIPAAYAFARTKIRFSDFFFTLYIIQILLPLNALIVPEYRIIKSMHLVDTRVSMILPFIASGYGTFLIRQAFKQVPKSLEDAAIMDGCGHLRLIWNVMIPLAKPAIITFSLISVATHWNDYLWPLIITNTDRVRTLTIGLGMFVQQESGADWGVLMAATLYISFPMVLLFLILQKTFLKSFFMTSGLKG